MILGSGNQDIENQLKALQHTFNVNFALDLG
jgi:starch synthase